MNSLQALPLGSKRPLPAISGSCRWLGRFSEALLDRGAALLEITTREGAREYAVLRLWEAGRPQGYRLTRTDTGEVRYIDVSFGPGRLDWSCDCPDFVRNAHRRADHCCKHVKAVHAGLKKHDLAEGGNKA